MGLLASGAEVAGYRIEALVGRGGMGIVYRARELGLDRVVALKVIAPELVEDAEIRRRFVVEARAAARIEHPHVIPVYAAGERDDVAYIAMRFIDGRNLRTLVRREGALEPRQAAELIEQAAAALDAIHGAGFVHRDVKPGNLLVDSTGHVYLTDFGLAKEVITQGGATRSGQWVGTVDYIAPEQIRGGRIDARADVYSLGGVLHFLLTGSVPFEREREEAKLWAALSDPPPVPSRLRPGLSAALDTVVVRAMAKDPDHRYPSAGDLGRATRAAATGEAPSAPERMVARGRAAPGGAPTEPGLAELSTVTAGVAPDHGRWRRPWVLVGGALVAAAAAATAIALHSGGGSGGAAVRSTATPLVTPTATATATAAVARVAWRIDHVGDRPNGVAIAHGDLWVSSYRQRWLTQIDAATGRERAQHPHVGRGATSIVSDGDSVWVAVAASRAIVRVDARSGKVVGRIGVPRPPRKVVVGGGDVWVGAHYEFGGGDELLRYDRGGRRLGRYRVRSSIGGLAYGAGAMWVALRHRANVARLDPAAGRLVTWIVLPAAADALYFGAGRLLATIADQNTVVRIDVRGRGSVRGDAGHQPTQAVAAGGRVFVAAGNDQAVVILDARTLLPAANPIHVGLNPYALAADDRSVWVTGQADNSLTRIDYR